MNGDLTPVTDDQAKLAGKVIDAGAGVGTSRLLQALMVVNSFELALTGYGASAREGGTLSVMSRQSAASLGSR